MRRALPLVVSLVLAVAGTAARAAPPAPSGPHPRMLLDRELREAWRADARRPDGPVARAIRVCRQAGETTALAGALYQGAGWAKVLQACLVAWGGTDRPVYARTAIRFFTALIDDLDRIGDGKGGDAAARRDSGYAIRNLGPYTALAYDWLHDQPEMTPELMARARQRWAAWLDWYRGKGYRARNPGTNYHAGYLAAATLIAIAQGGEAGEAGARLWQLVADELWGKDMAAALATGGILDGGDWPEGWQYGPLSVAHYAVAARVARRAGIEIAGVDAWLASVLRRHVYALTPGDRMHVGQDTGAATPTVAASALTLDAVALGDAAPDDKRWAKGELMRMKLVENEYLVYDALALPGDRPAAVPRETWPTWYAAAATGTVFARTRWDDRAVWLVAECAPALDVDHRQPKAGNFVLSRGADDVIVDPSPYGALSSLTSNAPTVRSAQLPEGYAPSQAPWSQRTAWSWTTQRSSGVIALRCDYADQYRFQERPSDVPDALRDLVLVPSRDGTAAVLIVVDRASTGGAGRPLYLRFRVPGKLALAGDVATASVGRRTQLAIAGLARSSGQPELDAPSAKDCFKAGTTRGGCTAARFPVTEYRVEVAGPEPRAIHAISVTGGDAPSSAPIGGAGWSGVRIGGVRDAVVVWPRQPHGALEYRAPRTRLLHVLLDAPETSDGKAAIAARADGADCVVKVTAGGEVLARPAVVQLDEACAVTVDPEVERAVAGGTQPGQRPKPPAATTPSKRGCCGAQTSPEAPLAMAVLAGVLLLRRRRRCGRGRERS